MQELTTLALKYDNGGRRLGIDRRQFSYPLHIPERRSGLDRRRGMDRRDMQASGLDDDTERRALFRADSAQLQ